MSVNDNYNERLRELKELQERLRNKPVVNDDFGTIACTEDGEYLLGGEPENYYKENK